MEVSTKDEIISDFVCVIDQIGKKPSDEIESSLQKNSLQSQASHSQSNLTILFLHFCNFDLLRYSIQDL